MLITEQQLLQILPSAGPRAGIFLPALNAAMDKYGIAGRLRVAAFIAQVGHESGQLRSVVENLNYSAQALIRTWPGRFTADLAARAARKPEAIANIVYASRMGNGSPATGDGWRYRGRGLIQVTGKSNYIAAGVALRLDLLNQPELLEQPQSAAMSAAHYFEARGLNNLADAGEFKEIGSIINTGQRGRVPNGVEDRQALYERALEVLA
ncbi:glycoside hydrolase family 19 protein [Pseudomonas agarici]